MKCCSKSKQRRGTSLPDLLHGFFAMPPVSGGAAVVKRDTVQAVIILLYIL